MLTRRRSPDLGNPDFRFSEAKVKLETISAFEELSEVGPDLVSN